MFWQLRRVWIELFAQLGREGDEVQRRRIAQIDDEILATDRVIPRW